MAAPARLLMSSSSRVELNTLEATTVPAVVEAVASGLLPLKEALERYSLSEEEFSLWREAVEKHGEGGLKVTAIQRYRQP